jgi:preprotein translocase subunit SecE
MVLTIIETVSVLAVVIGMIIDVFGAPSRSRRHQ